MNLNIALFRILFITSNNNKLVYRKACNSEDVYCISSDNKKFRTIFISSTVKHLPI